jgi:hypothetical protein
MGRSLHELSSRFLVRALRGAVGVALLGLFALSPTTEIRAQGEDREGIEFFEKSIRPVLLEQCSKCHGAESKKPKGGLSLDSPGGLLRGGDSGQAIVPGDPNGSLLIKAIRYNDDELKMPPKRRLSQEVVAAFEDWVKRGAPAPRATVPAQRTANAASQAGDHWAFRPPRESPVPRNAAGSPVDAFILDKLASQGLRLAPPADKHTLIRRATYDLIGLPPTPDEIEAFLGDRSPDAFARVVERLLASPAYGERWGRHWLDLVRYCDDFDDAWRYRDWVIRAFNDDLPYDQFITHQIAGDLLPARVPGDVNADGIVATTMLSLGPWGGIDRRKRLADIVDDQIDTIGRTFLGLTLACARCHDHKFDPISTADYYGLAGIFFSSHVIPEKGYLSHGTGRLRIPLVAPAVVEKHEQIQARIRKLEGKLQAAVDEAYARFARKLVPQTARYLSAAWDEKHRSAGDASVAFAEFAKRRGLEEFALRKWIDYLAAARLGPYRLLDQPVRDYDGEPGVEVWRVAAERPWWAVNTTAKDIGIETFLLPSRSTSINPGTEGGAVAWNSPVAGMFRVSGTLTDGDPYDGTGVAWAIDQLASDGTRRELASGRLPNGGTMRLDQGRAAERLAKVNVAKGDSLLFQIVLGQGDAHYDVTNVDFTVTRLDGAGEWDLTRDSARDFLAGNPHGDSLGNRSVWQFLDMAGSHRLSRMPAVDRFLGPAWDPVTLGVTAGKLERPALEAAAGKLGKALADEGAEGPLSHDLTGPRSPFHPDQRDDARYLSAADRESLTMLSRELEALKAQAPPLPSAHGAQEGGLRYGPSPGFQDARVHVRGSYSRLGAVVPRHFPTVLAGASAPSIGVESGRLELANWIASNNNPLTARVMVNRLWQHHFGEGLVRTPSNFGRLGEPPSHSELLDDLARRFVGSGWSIKAMHRLIMLSRTYQQSSKTSSQVVEADPGNRLLARMNRRRLEAEALHDSLLAIAGRLERQMWGPAEGDPLRKRRLVYLKVSRADRADFGALYDRANPALQVEKRTVSTVAPQALYLMNHAFMMEAAQGLAERADVVAEKDPGRRISRLYALVVGRPPTAGELTLGRDFVASFGKEPAPKLSPWSQYAQALLLGNEFLFVD